MATLADTRVNEDELELYIESEGSIPLGAITSILNEIERIGRTENFFGDSAYFEIVELRTGSVFAKLRLKDAAIWINIAISMGMLAITAATYIRDQPQSTETAIGKLVLDPKFKGITFETRDQKIRITKEDIGKSARVKVRLLPPTSSKRVADDSHEVIYALEMGRIGQPISFVGTLWANPASKRYPFNFTTANGQIFPATIDPIVHRGLIREGVQLAITATSQKRVRGAPVLRITGIYPKG